MARVRTPVAPRNSPQTATSAGLTPATEPANVDGNSIEVGAALQVLNSSAASVNVTVVTPGLVDGDLALPDRVVAVAAGAVKLIARLGPIYHQDDGTVHVNYSAVTTVTVAALKL